MNRNHVIKWCRTTMPNKWAFNINFPKPEGWSWIVVNRPYQVPEYVLFDYKTFQRVSEEDVKNDLG